MSRSAAWLLKPLCLWWLLPMPLEAAGRDFDRTIAPLLAARCLECHSGPRPKGGLDLTNAKRARRGGESGPAVVPGQLDKSLLWRRVSAGEMPPDHPLKADERRQLRMWILDGADWGTDPIDRLRYTTDRRAGFDWWSLQPIGDPRPPDVDIKGPAVGGLDRFILSRLKKEQLAPSAAASPRVLIRRLSIDLLGLPPSPETVAAFCTNPSEDAYRALVDRFLSSPDYGERWGRHWLDVVRFGESDGFERNAPRTNSWHYRDWVIESLNADMPYDRFARLQLVGDLELPGRSGAAAAGFLVAAVHNTVVGGSLRMKLLARQDELEELVGAVGQTFLGLTVNCARCHDHKFDPIRNTEYYRMVAALDGVNHGLRVVNDPAAQAEREQLARKIAVQRKHLDQLESRARRAVLARRKAARKEGGKKGKNPALAADRPRPIARWDFDVDLQDSIGSLHARAIGGARLENKSLLVDGKTAYVQTIRLKRPLAAKTLEAWVVLDNLAQRGGAAISIQTPGGSVFDAIVFGEREPGRWMAGSNGFVRTRSFGGEPERQATATPVHVAITYAADGTITGYRNGRLYGKPYKTSFQAFGVDNAEIVFGLRHSSPGGNKMLAGRILQASLYDRALSAEEVAASAGRESGFVSIRSLLSEMTADERVRRDAATKQLISLEGRHQRLASRARTTIYTVAPKQPGAMRVHLRGSVSDLGPVVTPGAVAAVGSIDGLQADFQLAANAPDRDRRQKLAAWITSPDNPLFARVIVNRLWHYHFGQGLVTTPSDFGFNGGRPSHPRLLDWLARRLVAGKYRLKPLHRLIVLSTTYRQSSRPRPGALSHDADNRLLWRFSPRRVEAEVLRDSILAVSGQLNPKRGGPGFVDVSITPNNGTTYYEPIDKEDPLLNRRTVYRFSPRGGRSAILDTFDCPDPASAAPRRGVTTTPLQALSLLNNSFVLRMADHAAARVARESGDDVTRQVIRAWRLAIQRGPDTRERQLSLDLVRRHGLAALCRALFNTNDFIIID